MKRIWIVLSIFITLTLPILKSQELKTTELEKEKLAKLKAQSEVLQTKLEQIDTQIQALNVYKQLIDAQQKSKLSELLGYSEEIKKNHKEWGDSSKVNYNQSIGESGIFKKIEDKK